MRLKSIQPASIVVIQPPTLNNVKPGVAAKPLAVIPIGKADGQERHWDVPGLDQSHQWLLWGDS